MGALVHIKFRGLQPTEELVKSAHQWCATILGGTQWEQIARWRVMIDRGTEETGPATLTHVALRIGGQSVRAEAVDRDIQASLEDAFRALARNLRYELYRIGASSSIQDSPIVRAAKQDSDTTTP